MHTKTGGRETKKKAALSPEKELQIIIIWLCMYVYIS